MEISSRALDAITLFVDDPGRSRPFYTALLGVAAMFEDDDSLAFRMGDVTVNLLIRRAAGEVVEPQPVAPAGVGAQALLTIGVDDVDAACAALAEQGLTPLNGPVDRPWGVRTAAFADPDGHVWELAQSLSGPGPGA
jgi:lactoylglutathione lyase